MAIQVPYKPVFEQQPSGQAIRGLSVDTPGAAFGTNVGEAIQGLGKTLEASGDTIFRRAMALQELDNEEKVSKRFTQFLDESSPIHAEFETLKGDQAKAAFPKYKEDLNKLREKIGSDLPPVAKKQYDNQTRNFYSRMIFNATGHVATEFKRAIGGAAESEIGALGNKAMSDPDDEGGFRQSLNDIDAKVRGTLAPIRGWQKPQEDQEVFDRKSGLIAARAIGMARLKPFEAKEFFDRYKGQLNQADMDRVDKVVQGSVRTIGARYIDDEVNKDLINNPKGGGKTIQQRAKEAERIAKQRAPNDPLLADYARKRVMATYSEFQAARKEIDFNNRNTVEGALMGSKATGKVPTTTDDLFQDMSVRNAWESLDNHTQRTYMKVLTQNARGDFSWNEDRLRKYSELKGTAISAPAEFLDKDIASEQMPWSARRELLSLQQRTKGRLEGDPRVSRAMDWIRRARGAEMEALKIFNRGDNKEDYDRFTSSLQEALEAWQTTHNGKAPTNKEVIEDIAPSLLKEMVSPGKLFGNIWPNKTPMFKQEPIEAFAERLKADTGREFSPQEIQRAYIRAQLILLYQQKKNERK